MNQGNGKHLVLDFIKRLSKVSQFSIDKASIPGAKNIYKVLQNEASLLYLRSIAKKPYQWGVTNNIIERLDRQPLHWAVILLFNTPETGYLLSSHCVFVNVKKEAWPTVKGE
jgi:hypothetical protein